MRRLFVALVCFALASPPVYSQQVAPNSARVSWIAPTKNNDGTPLTNLAGFKVMNGPKGGPYTKSVYIESPQATSYLWKSLRVGEQCFVVVAFNTLGLESPYSAEVCKNIKFPGPTDGSIEQ